MKKIHAAKAANDTETRTPLTPETATKLIQSGFEVSADPGIGLSAGYSDAAFKDAGVSLVGEQDAGPDIVIRIQKPDTEEINRLKAGTLHVSFLDPFNEKELIGQMATAGISSISLEMIPRTTLAQKMDVLSSQANLAGYFAVIKAAEMLGKILPMMMTPAGTIAPARVFIVGVGVAGLQAIATAKRLGAQVEAFDTRPVVEEQVKSLGAKFLKIDLGETGQTDQGYARELTPEQIQKQKDGMKKACANADIVITTAKLFGRPAPKIVDADMVTAMRPGSVIVDLAAETGGNVEGTQVGRNIVTENGVKIIGQGKLEGAVAKDSSQMVASNFQNLLLHFWNKEAEALKIDLDDEIMKGCLITHDGAVVHERFKEDA